MACIVSAALTSTVAWACFGTEADPALARSALSDTRQNTHCAQGRSQLRHRSASLCFCDKHACCTFLVRNSSDPRFCGLVACSLSVFTQICARSSRKGLVFFQRFEDAL